MTSPIPDFGQLFLNHPVYCVCTSRSRSRLHVSPTRLYASLCAWIYAHDARRRCSVLTVATDPDTRATSSNIEWYTGEPESGSRDCNQSEPCGSRLRMNILVQDSSIRDANRASFLNVIIFRDGWKAEELSWEPRVTIVRWRRSISFFFIESTRTILIYHTKLCVARNFQEFLADNKLPAYIHIVDDYVMIIRRKAIWIFIMLNLLLEVKGGYCVLKSGNWVGAQSIGWENI